MRWWLAILFTLFLLAVTSELSLWLGSLPTFVTVIGTALWAAFDSSKIKLAQYKSAMPYKPVTVFLCVILLWIIAFPWYLAVRYRIKAGKAKLRENPTAHVGILSHGI
jgi:hypothetical protein